MAQDSKATLRHDRQLRLLEAELARTTERFRVAKLASREAKADAKQAKREMKRARKALIALQEADEQPKTATAKRTAAKAASKDSTKTKGAARAASPSKPEKSSAAVKPATTKPAPVKRSSKRSSDTVARKRTPAKKVTLPETIAAIADASAQAANADLRPMSDADLLPTTETEGLQRDETA